MSRPGDVRPDDPGAWYCRHRGGQRRPAARRAVRADDAAAVEHGARGQPDRSVPVRPRGGARVQAPRRGPRGLLRGRQDRLHELGPRHHSLGRARQLRGVEGRRDADDEEHRPGGGTLPHPGERDRPGRHPHADQHRRLGDARGLRRPDAADPLQADRRARGRRPRRRLARLRRGRLPDRHDALRRRRHDPLPRLRDGGLSAVDTAALPLPRPQAGKGLAGPLGALKAHWPEYLMEAWGLGTFMVSAGVFGTLLFHPASPVARAVPDPLTLRALMGVLMGLTAVALIYSPWGRQSGAHLNPAVTLTFLRLGKVRPWDALFYVLAQAAGGTAGVLLVAAALGPFFREPPVAYVATAPGEAGGLLAPPPAAPISLALVTGVPLPAHPPPP